MRTIGLIVNPIGGIGGRVDLKGADGEMHEKALAMDTETVSPARVQEFLSHVSYSDKIRLLVVPSLEAANTARGGPGAYDGLAQLSWAEQVRRA